MHHLHRKVGEPTSATEGGGRKQTDAEEGDFETEGRGRVGRTERLGEEGKRQHAEQGPKAGEEKDDDTNRRKKRRNRRSKQDAVTWKITGYPRDHGS